MLSGKVVVHSVPQGYPDGRKNGFSIGAAGVHRDGHQQEVFLLLGLGGEEDLDAFDGAGNGDGMTNLNRILGRGPPKGRFEKEMAGSHGGRGGKDDAEKPKKKRSFSQAFSLGKGNFHGKLFRLGWHGIRFQRGGSRSCLFGRSRLFLFDTRKERGQIRVCVFHNENTVVPAGRASRIG